MLFSFCFSELLDSVVKMGIFEQMILIVAYMGYGSLHSLNDRNQSNLPNLEIPLNPTLTDRIAALIFQRDLIVLPFDFYCDRLIKSSHLQGLVWLKTVFFVSDDCSLAYFKSSSLSAERFLGRNKSRCFIILLLLVSGNIHPKPGPLAMDELSTPIYFKN